MGCFSIYDPLVDESLHKKAGFKDHVIMTNKANRKLVFLLAPPENEPQQPPATFRMAYTGRDIHEEGIMTYFFIHVLHYQYVYIWTILM